MGYIQLKLPKRIKNKIENSKRNREAQANHEEWLQSQGLDTYTLKQKTKNFKGYDVPDYSPDPTQPKTSDKIPVNGGRKQQPQAYSGERKLIGIGLMHKSNLVPVWDEEGAKEITLMKGNK
tara:strand:+ start:801 stop:1163 length:363 start_codon:yes stop_codon:yes gene_type:complete